MDLIVTVILIAFFIFIGSTFFKTVEGLKQSKKNEVVRYLNSIIHQVNIEKYQDIEYWYDVDNNRFLGQGKSFDEVVNVLKTRFPDHIFLLDNGGVAAATNWELKPFDEIRKIDFHGYYQPQS